jgi:alpha-tubulin suppressor-like RCC1 family protein
MGNVTVELGLYLSFYTLGAVATAAGDKHTCALLNDSKVYCWGNNENGQLGTGDLNQRLSPTAVVGLEIGT